jgi:hypothetical protein
LSSPVRCISCRKQMVGSCFLFQSTVCVFWLENWDH